MKPVYRVIKWCLFLNKRLLKKPSFLLVLLMVPCLVAGMLLVSEEESSVLKVALYGEEQDANCKAIIDTLTSGESIIKYEKMESAEAARRAVLEGKADTAWIFAEELTQTMETAAKTGDLSDLVTMVQREDNMQLRLVKVKLYAAVYPEYLYVLFEDFMGNRLGAVELTQEELLHYFSSVNVNEELFQRSYMDREEKVLEANYLLAPLRGMLAVWLVLAVLAAVMYYMQDERAGLFDRIPGTRRMGIAIGYQCIVAIDGFLIVLCSLFFTGNFITFSRECFCLLLYGAGVIGFCNLIRVICKTMERTGAVIPIIMVALMVFTPVFLDLKSLRPIQSLFPAYYYLKSIHSFDFRVEMFIYAVILWGIGFILENLSRKYGN